MGRLHLYGKMLISCLGDATGWLFQYPANLRMVLCIAKTRKAVAGILYVFFTVMPACSQRVVIPLNDDWQTSLAGSSEWKQVTVPHNWDDYYGYRRQVHGNLHGDALYKKTFTVRQPGNGKRFFLYFEGVGSYATVWMNNKQVGYHAGGRTTFTIDVTNVIRTDGSANLLEVKVSHPAYIVDLPWVCGGCSRTDRGFSEGSQPLGIFRPVHLVVTNEVRIQPFGVHAWADIQKKEARLHSTVTLMNYGATAFSMDTIIHYLVDQKGKVVAGTSETVPVYDQIELTIPIPDIVIKDPHLWSPEDPYCYRIVTIIKNRKEVIDRTETLFGFRTVQWDSASHRFILNGKPVFINGVAEYEHMIGQSHAFSEEQVRERMKWVQRAGFNAFRDAHQPHNLLYGHLCDSLGVLWWTQFSAHIWYDTDKFRDNFKRLLRDWVIERRNDPSVIMWGLQNESQLPSGFAKECTDLIRYLDPTASLQRPVTTCNGGEGTDWNVPQNWSGTYGGDPDNYGEELKKEILVGEYGAWRTIDLHTEGGFEQNGAYSEDRFTLLMEKKIRLAESVKDSVAGQFFWLLSSHDNPGRVQGGEGWRELDRIGPVNYKGMLTAWDEPTDAFYMFRSNYVSAEKEPMVYIASHTWPNRWLTPGMKNGIAVYSNCGEVELFNDIRSTSLGRKTRNGTGTHFQWDNVNIQYNILYAVGYVNGKAVAADTIVLTHLPAAPHYPDLFRLAENITRPQMGYSYLYRINCGGGFYRDQNGNDWLPDKNYFHSWAEDFENIPVDFASQRRTFSPLSNTVDEKLFQSFRYGKDKLRFEFAVPDGDYQVELYFIEPWLGIGGYFEAAGMRLFDVAVNGKTVLKNLDLWKEAGTNKVLKKTVTATIRGGKLVISFPGSTAGQALVAAIAVAEKQTRSVGMNRQQEPRFYRLQSWLDIGEKQFADQATRFHSLPPNLFGASWVLQVSTAKEDIFVYKPGRDTDLFLAIRNGTEDTLLVKDFENTRTQIVTDENGGTRYDVYRKRIEKGAELSVKLNPQRIICLQPVSNMQPAYDLKPVKAYRTDIAETGKSVIKENRFGRFCTVVHSDGESVIQWPVQTGVADHYSVTVKYHYGGEKAAGRIQLIDAGGKRLLDLPVEFNFTRDGKWNQFTVRTESMINAGNYMVKLVITDGRGLAVSGIEMQ